jgi:AAA+ superfamily predicted ATPase
MEMKRTTAAARLKREKGVSETLERAIKEGSCALFTGHSSDIIAYEAHLMRLPQIISKFCADRDMPTITYSLEGNRPKELRAPGGPEARIPGNIGERTAATLALDRIFDAMEKSGTPTALVIDYAESLIPAGGRASLDQERIKQQILQKATDNAWRARGCLLVLIGRFGPPDESFTRMPGILNHEIALPEIKEREFGIRTMLRSPSHPLSLSSDFSVEECARISGGIHMDTLSRLRYSADNAHPLIRDVVLDVKKDMIRRQAGDALTIHDVCRDLEKDVAGAHQLLRYVRNLKEEGRHTARLLLLGPPGTGKSYSAPAVARALGTVPISLSQVKSMWVGESERMFRFVLNIIESNRPLCLILDEADQLSMGSRTGAGASVDSSSVDASLRGMLLEYLGDTSQDNGVSVIAMSNNPAGVDPAFRNRMEIIPILEATRPVDKAGIVMIELERRGIEGDAEGIARAFAESPRNFTGRHIVKMLGLPVREAKRRGNAVGCEEMRLGIENALHAFGPPEELMSLLAVRYAHSREYLPWIAAGDAGDAAVEPPEYLKPFLFNNCKEIDTEALDARIRELQACGC